MGSRRADLPLALVLLAPLLLLAPTTAAEAACQAIPDGATHWWAADGTPDDAIGGQHGTLVGGATYGTGVHDQAFSLDGVDDYVDLGTGSAGDFGTADFTVSVWVNYDSTSGEQVLIERYIEGSPNTGWTLTKTSGNTLLFWVGGHGHVMSAGVSPTPGTWHSAAITREAHTFALYWDGAHVATGSATGLDLSSTSSLKLGHRGSPSDTPGSNDNRGFWTDGRIDETRLFDRALTADEINGLHVSQGAPPCPDPAPPVPELPTIVLVGAAMGVLALARMRRG